MTAASRGAAPRRSRWWSLVWAAPAAVVSVVMLVVFARGLRELSAVQDWIEAHPGTTPLPDAAPIGLPAWLGWQHFLNGLFLLLIIRTGWQVRTTTRPAAHWTRTNTGPFRTRNPPQRISLQLWLHLSLDVLWVLNGVVFVVLLSVTGQWLRIVPTSWDVIPNALSAGLQYASLDWPHENGWVNSNSLQLLAYFTTVFVAAPLAIVTGIRMSPAWPERLIRLSRLYPIEVARAVHVPVMLYFVLFVIAHVTLVFATGALKNLNHMYGARDDGSWWGLGVFAVSAVAMVAVWIAARPMILRPIASLTGKVTR